MTGVQTCALPIFSFIKQSFWWKIGKYSLEFIISSPEKFTLFDNKYEFELTSFDIDNLEKNKDFIEQLINIIGKSVTDHEYKPEEINWNWRNPVMQKSS